MPLHNNAFALQVSDAKLQDTAPWGGSKSLGSVLLEPTVIYVRRLLALIDAVDVKVSSSFITVHSSLCSAQHEHILAQPFR